jgi:hypothetical protein
LTLDAITPSSLVQGSTAQAVTLTGTAFDANVTITVNEPTGNIAILSGSNIQGVSATFIQCSMVFNVAGSYVFVVNGASGVASNPITLLVTKS